ncbi:hypothetical protein [Stetteria hydrogenophila]
MGCGGLVVVNDTGALLSGLPLRLPARHVAPRAVVEEVRDRESRELLERMIEYGRLEVEDPPAGALGRARLAARRAGVLGRLSQADLSVLALALAYRDACGDVAAATDDYALQLALARAGVRVVRIRYQGVREARG